MYFRLPDKIELEKNELWEPIDWEVSCADNLRSRSPRAARKLINEQYSCTLFLPSFCHFGLSRHLQIARHLLAETLRVNASYQFLESTLVYCYVFVFRGWQIDKHIERRGACTWRIRHRRRACVNSREHFLAQWKILIHFARGLRVWYVFAVFFASFWFLIF